jgi:septal ring factor EnvC (AmiA/AmiB activator)
LEKNFVIMQYESLLSQLSGEFHKLLAKARETDEHVAAQEFQLQTQKKLLEDKEATIFQQEQVSAQLQAQVQDLLREMETLAATERSRREQADEANSVERDVLE